MEPRSVLVLLVDDEPDVTNALSWLLDSVKLRSRAFNSPRAFLDALCDVPQPACAVLDLRMPEMSGLELQVKMAEMGLDLPHLFLSAHGDVPAAVRAMQGGAVNFLQKPFNPEDFLNAVQKIVRIACERYESQTRERDLKDLLERLSGREADVLGELVRGRTSKEIARALAISPKTVDAHRANIIRKLDVRNVVDLVRMVQKLHGQP